MLPPKQSKMNYHMRRKNGGLANASRNQGVYSKLKKTSNLSIKNYFCLVKLLLHPMPALQNLLAYNIYKAQGF